MATPVVAIANEDFLFRRLSTFGHINPDGSVNSNAYKKDGKPDPEISVELATMTTVREALLRAPNKNFKIGILSVEKVRALGLSVDHQPTEGNPAHATIRGNASRATCRDLASRTWLSALESV